MLLGEKLKEFFKNNKKFYNINYFIKKFNLSEFEVEDLKKALLELEKKGEIYYENGNYIAMSSCTFLKFGKLLRSNKNNYYIKTKEGYIILINEKNLKEMHAKEGDYVFIEPTSIAFSKKATNNGVIKRIVTEEAREINYYLKTKLKKDYKNQRYYIDINGKMVYLNQESLNGAFENDIVTVLLKGQNNIIEAIVVEVIKAKKEQRVFVKTEKGWVSIDNRNYKAEVTNDQNLIIGDEILASYSFDKNTKKFKLKLVKKITNNLEEYVREIANSYGFSKIFPSKENINDFNISKDASERKDLRNLMTFTIDPPYAKDLDDAISLEKLGDCYRLYVHIADVDYFVPFKSELFNQAISYGTSCYPSVYVFPQLPPYYSDDKCSLNFNEDKYAKTIVIDVDFNGNIIDFQIFKSIIRSDKKMSYDKVNELLEERILHLDYLPFREKLLEMNELSAILQTRKIKRGCLCFNNLETQVKLNEKDEVVKIEEERFGIANQIIENFMLLANEAVTDYCYWLNLPFVYRNHEKPSISKLCQLKHSLRSSNLKINEIKKMREQLYFQKRLLSLYKRLSKTEWNYVSTMFLTSLEKAYYSGSCIGHFGLALNRYGTVTSPIRRGSDLINHAVLTEFLNNGVSTAKMDELQDYILNISQHLTEREIAAESCEMDVKKYLIQKYAQQFVNCNIFGIIEHISEKEIFIRTDNNIMGFIPINSQIYIDINNNCAFIEGKKYNVQDKIEVCLVEPLVINANFQLCFKPCLEQSLKYKK